jgi:hypothetical protein
MDAIANRVAPTAVLLLAIVGCGRPVPSSALPSSALGYPFRCGPVQQIERCQDAIRVAAAGRLNEPPVVGASIRHPRPGDDCLREFLHPCGPEEIVVEVQSGDAVEAIAVVRTSDGWILHSQMR